MESHAESVVDQTCRKPSSFHPKFPAPCEHGWYVYDRLQRKACLRYKDGCSQGAAQTFARKGPRARSSAIGEHSRLLDGHSHGRLGQVDHETMSHLDVATGYE